MPVWPFSISTSLVYQSGQGKYANFFGVDLLWIVGVKEF